MGMSGDMFSAAMISLGVPPSVLTEAMERAARPLGAAKVEVQRVQTTSGPAVRLRTELKSPDAPLRGEDARQFLDRAIQTERLEAEYADFARRTLDALMSAERDAHSSLIQREEEVVRPIGVAHTPYSKKSPYQPPASAEGDFYVEIFPEFAAGLSDLETLSHVFIISLLHLSPGYSLTVTPPWMDGSKPVPKGLFATRSPNRPNPLGLTLAEVRRVTHNRVYTGPLDLLDGTPILDIKPHVRTLDETLVGDDGWLADTDHLELHKRGVPHKHQGEEAVLHEAKDILLDIIGGAKGLQFLRVALDEVKCLSPVSVGGGTVRFSHGELPVPAPAVMSLLKRFRIPHVSGPVEAELLTPTGAALLAALRPNWLPRTDPIAAVRRGLGLGTRELETINGLWLFLS